MDRIDVGQLPSGKWLVEPRDVYLHQLRAMGDTREEALVEFANNVLERLEEGRDDGDDD